MAFLLAVPVVAGAGAVAAEAGSVAAAAGTAITASTVSAEVGAAGVATAELGSAGATAAEVGGGVAEMGAVEAEISEGGMIFDQLKKGGIDPKFAQLIQAGKGLHQAVTKQIEKQQQKEKEDIQKTRQYVEENYMHQL